MCDCSDSQEVGLEAAILERVRNSSLVEWSRADNLPGLKPGAEAADGLVFKQRGRGRGALPAQRSRPVRGGGALGSENAGMSSVRDVSKRPHRMAEVSAARFILGGLVGPKPMPKGVGYGQTVDIPLPLRTIKSQVGAGWVRPSAVLEILRLSVQAASSARVAVPRRGEARSGEV